MLDDRVQKEGLFHVIGQLVHGGYQLVCRLRRQCVPAAQHPRQHEEGRELRGESLGGGDTNFRTGAGEENQI